MKNSDKCKFIESNIYIYKHFVVQYLHITIFYDFVLPLE